MGEIRLKHPNQKRYIAWLLEFVLSNKEVQKLSEYESNPNLLEGHQKRNTVSPIDSLLRSKQKSKLRAIKAECLGGKGSQRKQKSLCNVGNKG